jgi:peptidoglycan/LPS O-acetylase OafA/YrhL
MSQRLAHPDRLGYVPALDGVRALAVLAVVAFHFGAGWLPGGYVGVDVFFVLSGFLITTLLLLEHERTGRLDLPAFWGRRARRLLPALLLLVACLAIWAATLATPEQASALRADAIAALLYVANWWFVVDAQDYLQAGEPSLLLHTWSLGVEEQWYVVAPLLLLVLLRRHASTRRLLAVVLTLAAASALLMLVLGNAGASHARVYYGTDTRVFALLLGCAAAVLIHRRGLPGRRAADAAGVAGLLVLGTAATLMAADSPAVLRGGLLLVAAGSVGLVVAAATPSTYTARALSLPPLVLVGVLSYGLYLWHWPVQLLLADEPWTMRLGLALGAAVVSYELVERPIGHASWATVPRLLKPAVPAVAVGAAAALVLGATSTGTAVPQGRLGESMQVVPTMDTSAAATRSIGDGSGEDASREDAASEGPEHPARSVRANRRDDAPPARRLGPGEPVDVLVVGDSVGFTLAYHAPDEASAIRVFGDHVLGCGLTDEPLGLPSGGVLERPHCVGYLERWPQLLRRTDPHVVVLVAGAWELYDHMADDGGVPAQRLQAGTWAHDLLIAGRLRRALAETGAGGRPVLVTDIPCFVVKGALDPRADRLRIAHLNGLLTRVVSDTPGARLIRMSEQVCPDGVDALGRAGRYDGVHFTAAGAAQVWEWLAPLVRAEARAAATSSRG